MSRDYRAKRLARELDIPYTEALRRVRQAAEALTAEERPAAADEGDAR